MFPYEDKHWISDVMAELGYPGVPSEYLDTVNNYNNDGRETTGADWAFTAFIVRAVNQPGNNFPGSRPIGITYLGGPLFATAES